VGGENRGVGTQFAKLPLLRRTEWPLGRGGDGTWSRRSGAQRGRWAAAEQSRGASARSAPCCARPRASSPRRRARCARAGADGTALARHPPLPASVAGCGRSGPVLSAAHLWPRADASAFPQARLSLATATQRAPGTGKGPRGGPGQGSAHIPSPKWGNVGNGSTRLSDARF
jgi:hypothetical protein